MKTRNFSAEFKRESAQLVIDQNYTVADAAKAMDVSLDNADDCNVYVRSQKAGERVLRWMRKMYEQLHLRMNEKKTEVGPVFGRKFLSYCLRRWSENTVKIAVAPKALDTGSSPDALEART